MTLTPLKVAYKKLRLLVDRGCIFVGHGLSKDFRIISEYKLILTYIRSIGHAFADIYVPPEQVIDTVDLYFLKARQRRLSLRFLSWFVLGEHIQQETHDSIEDARSALRLYNAFQTFEEQGIFDQKLEELYKEGRQFVSVQPLIDQHSREFLRRISNHPLSPANKPILWFLNMLHLPYHCNQPNTSASQPPYLTRTLYRSIVTRAQWLDTPCTGIVTGEDSLSVHNVIYFFSFFSYKDVTFL